MYIIFILDKKNSRNQLLASVDPQDRNETWKGSDLLRSIHAAHQPAKNTPILQSYNAVQQS